MAVSYKAGKNSVTGKIGTNSSAPYYTQDPVTVTITVQERNFVVGGAEASVTQKDFGGRDVKPAGTPLRWTASARTPITALVSR